jgi:putative DNA primase/helicase
MLTGIGQNGKSVYLDILAQYLGEENLSHEQLQGICHSSFSSAELYGKLANICGDLPAVIIEDTGNFKQLTSGMDSVSAQKKFMNPFNYVNSAKLLFSANEIPEAKDQTEAFFRRWLIIDFPYKFVSGLTDEEYVGFVKKEDKSIIDKLTTEQELEGLLNNSVSILHELLNTKQFTNSPKTEEIKNKYNLKSNSAMMFMELFVDDQVEDENSEYVQKEHLYQQYVEYCKFKGVNFKKAEGFFRSMKDRWNPSTEKRTVALGVRKNCFIGIRYLGWREVEGLAP